MHENHESAIRRFLLLFRFFVSGVLSAEPAILGELEPIRIVFLVLRGIVVSLLALCAS